VGGGAVAGALVVPAAPRGGSAEGWFQHAP
jgi:hypothetical protein